MSSPTPHERLRALYTAKPVVLAPMEDVTDVVFRRLCRRLGATVAMTEFVNVEGLLRGCRNAKRKIQLAPDDTLTGIQIYGSDPARLAEAASFAEQAQPLFLDINCGCWVPKIAGRGAGRRVAPRDPSAMVAMTKMVVERVAMPVTVKTRVGLGPESHMPIVDLARRLEDAGAAALTIHCRTAQMGHSGAADWTWAAKARAVVTMPVLVNGDVKSAEDAVRAMAETGCEGTMIGRRAVEHPWVFGEARALIDHGQTVGAPHAGRSHRPLPRAPHRERPAARGALRRPLHAPPPCRLPQGPPRRRRPPPGPEQLRHPRRLPGHPGRRRAGRRRIRREGFTGRAEERKAESRLRTPPSALPRCRPS